MADKNILHMLTPLKHVSPFDVNMALDAGYDAVVPYGSVGADEVRALVQDAIFSRPPDRGVRTGVFIGGRDAIQALDMLEAAKQALVPPFELSVFADPAGSFTTAAAMVACVETVLQTKKAKSLRGLKVVVFGATGVVGFSGAVISALEGAMVKIVGYDGVERVAKRAAEMKERFGVEVEAVDGSSEDKKTAIVAAAQVVLCAGRAGVQVLSAEQVAAAKELLVAADVNAVPPLGVEGLGLFDDGKEIAGSTALGVGALAIGNIKYRTEFGLLEKMIAATKTVAYDFRDAFALARELNA